MIARKALQFLVCFSFLAGALLGAVPRAERGEQVSISPSPARPQPKGSRTSNKRTDAQIRKCLWKKNEAKRLRRKNARENHAQFYRKVDNLADLPQTSFAGDLNDYKLALDRQKNFCKAPKGVPASVKIGDCQLSSDQWCNQMTETFMKAIDDDKSKTLAEFASLIRTRFDWYELQGSNGSKGVQETGYYTPVIEASRKKTDEYSVPIYGKPPELVHVSFPGDVAVANHWRVKNANGQYVKYYTRQEIENGKIPRELAIAYVKDLPTLIDLQIEGSGQFVIHEPDGKGLTTSFLGYAAENSQPNNMPASIMDCMGYDPSTWSTQRRILDYFKQHPDEIKKIMRFDPSYVFYQEQKGGPYGMGQIQLTKDVSLASNPRILPTGLTVLYTAQELNKDTGKVEEVSRVGIPQDRGGAVNFSVDRYRGEGATGFALSESLNVHGRLFIPVPKNCPAVASAPTVVASGVSPGTSPSAPPGPAASSAPAAAPASPAAPPAAVSNPEVPAALAPQTQSRSSSADAPQKNPSL
ncbi:MAG: hypothetical protein C5B49_04385 [Bdellovibrio sp.]|nr:MAG: hypothetical protein C5B49_04385 [Bdellovibrio sp.]